MTASNEPGRPGPADPPGSGPADAGQRPGPRTGAARLPDSEPPRRRAAPQPRSGPVPKPSVSPETPAGAHSSGLSARVQRFVAGGSAPADQPGGAKSGSAEPEPPRAEGQRGDGYPSELPDLSKPASRTAQRGATAARPQSVLRPRGPVRASMQVRRIDPWSTLKVSLLLSVALFFVWMAAVAFLYLVLGAMGVWSKLNSNVGDLLTNTNGAAELVSGSSIFSGALLIGLVNIVLLTAMATLGAVVYNISTDLIGGIEVTLADRD